MKIRTLALAWGALSVALALAGCAPTTSNGMDMDHGSTTPSESPAESAEFNGADVSFATNMAIHHQQAVKMADLLLAKEGVDERVIELADNIKAAQASEIETMHSWFEAWGEAVPSEEGMEGMDHGGMTMPADDMAALESATGADASQLFLEQMTVHHQGAIGMAEVEIDTGANPDALELARSVIESQTAEIAAMQDLLETL